MKDRISDARPNTALGRWTRRAFLLFTTAVAATTWSTASLAQADDATGRKWVASWAISPAAYFVYTAPVPPVYPPGAPTTRAPATIQPDLAYPFPYANTLGAVNQTFRTIVKPDLWGRRMRVHFSNVFGNAPVTFSAVTLALQDYAANVVDGTVTTLRFGGSSSVTIPAGTEVWSDGVVLDWVNGPNDKGVQGRNLAISYAVAGNAGRMTFHNNGHQTSYISSTESGDKTRDIDGLQYWFSTTSTFFLTGLDVMAPANTVVVAAFGDSITEGVHSTLSGNDRWSNVLSARLHAAYGNRVSVVNAAISGNRVTNPVPANSTAGPAAVDRIDRDLLGLSGLTHVIWLEGINDLAGAQTPQNVIAGYQNVVTRLHAAGVKVYGGTVISSLGRVDEPHGWYPGYGIAHSGPTVNAARQVLNSFIRTSGNFDGFVDFDTATLDPNTGNMREEYTPNSEFTQLPIDYLHPNRAGYNAMGLAVDISPFRPR